MYLIHFQPHENLLGDISVKMGREDIIHGISIEIGCNSACYEDCDHSVLKLVHASVTYRSKRYQTQFK